ncbi:MAG TPA: CorA family divalent cation transporter, partial [Segetibacter sp.]
MGPHKIFKRLIKPIFNTSRTKEILSYNPAIGKVREDAVDSKMYVFNYSPERIEKFEVRNVTETFHLAESNKICWINIDGICKQDVEAICQHFKIHNLLVEDILSIGQRPKMDDIEGVLFCLLNMLYFNEQKCAVEQEQISIVLGKNFVITFQDDAHRDVFNSIRDRLFLPGSKLRQRGADYLCYSLVDVIVDNYFGVMEKLGGKIEELEEEIVRNSNTRSLAKLNSFRKELILLKRNVAPVRELVNGFIKSENELLADTTN